MARTTGTQTRVSRAVEELEKLVDQFGPGSRIGSKVDLAERLGVAAGTLDQAIRLLQSRGLIELRPGVGGGLFASTPNPLEQLSHEALQITRGKNLIHDAVRVRGALDPLLIDDVMQHATASDRKRIVEILRELYSAAERNDRTGFIGWSHEFKMGLADISGNEFTRLIFRTALQLISEAEPDPYPDDIDLMERYDGHLRLWQAILAKDHNAARSVVDEALSFY